MIRLAFAALSVTVLAACQAPTQAAEPARGRPPGSAERQLAEITSVTVAKTSPNSITVTVKAMAPTPGYSHFRLKPVTYIQAPPDGIYDLTAVGVPPGGIVAQVLSPVSFTYAWQTYPGELKGVRVHALSNSATAKLG